VVAMRERVKFHYDDSLAKDTATVSIRMRNGREFTHTTRHNKGTPGNPMSDDELSRKFSDLASSVVGPARSRQILEDLWRFDQLEDIQGLVRLCIPA
jgi:2-methylcitrate dehydratase PrpD